MVRNLQTYLAHRELCEISNFYTPLAPLQRGNKSEKFLYIPPLKGVSGMLIVAKK
jgi:hypothetical protein